MSVTDPTQDFQPLFGEQTESVILARMIGWANEGLDPVADADSWVDTREGGHWRTVEMPAVREFARLYDLAGTEVPMSGFVLWAWGTYLDDLAAVWQVFRLAGVASVGVETFTGPAGSVIDAGTTLVVVPSSADDPAPSFEVTTGGVIPSGGSIDLPIRCTEIGTTGDVAANAITEPSTPLPSGVTATNAAATNGGADPENDTSLLGRVLAATAGRGPGTAQDYVRWAREQAAIGSVKVVPLWSGPGTVLVVVADAAGLPISSAIVSDFQALLDPVAGKGSGLAPIGAIATVNTPALLNLAFAATFVFETGYSWTGAAGTVALGPVILPRISAYLMSVAPGDAVIHAQVLGILTTTTGVSDVTALTINAGGGPVTTNVPVALSPPQTAVLASFTAS